jgi:hypothetical protein
MRREVEVKVEVKVKVKWKCQSFCYRWIWIWGERLELAKNVRVWKARREVESGK